MKSLDTNHEIRLQQKFFFTFVLELLLWPYLSIDSCHIFFFNSFVKKSAKLGKLANIAAEVRQNDLYRIWAEDHQNHYTFVKSPGMNRKIRLQQKFCFTYNLKML